VTRYDKLAANYLAFIQLASIRLWLRVNESVPSFHRALGRQAGTVGVASPGGEELIPPP
jgi:hypothetical protein